MKFSYYWLKELIEFDQTHQQIADILTMIGHEVDTITPLGTNITGIITGKIVDIISHPNADKLVITSISIGDKTIQIVTGATNIKTGDIVPVSPAGAIIANGTVIKSSELRGEKSDGMLCSESELGVSDASDGIWILPSDTPIGIDFVKYAFLQDVILDVAILPNRGDCQSHIGLARDLAAYFKKKIKLPKLYNDNNSESSLIKLINNVSNDVPNYTARRVSNIKSSLTPLWMQQRLRVCGIRPINCVVDITNYVLLEFGQPLHAFDKAVIINDSISINYANNQQKFCFLDNDILPLTQTDIVITTNDIPIALGGIMGGANSQVTELTNDIILESAEFNSISIRKSALRLVKRTESAIRFEKGVDSDGVINASNRAAYLYQTLTGATIYSLEQTQIPNAITQKELPYSFNNINELLGTTYSNLLIDETLTHLGFSISNGKIKIPTWRFHDIDGLPCLAEEVARIAGIDSIPLTLPQKGIVQEAIDTLVNLQFKLRPFLTHLGFNEIVTYPMVSKQDCDLFSFNSSNHLQIQNPISKDESFMRPLLLPSLLKVLSHNQLRQNVDLKLFEIGKVFGESVEEEQLYLAGIFSGQWNPYLYKTNSFCNFGNLMGILTQLTQFLSLELHFLETKSSFFHPIESLSILFKNQVVGSLGMIHPKVAKKYKLVDPVYYFDISLSIIHKYCFSTKLFSPFSRYPFIRRDLALIVPKDISYTEIHSIFNQSKPKLVTRFFLFDLFESDQIGPNQKSMAFAFIYQDLNKTLSDDKVNRAHAHFIKSIQQKLPVKIR